MDVEPQENNKRYVYAKGTVSFLRLKTTSQGKPMMMFVMVGGWSTRNQTVRVRKGNDKISQGKNYNEWETNVNVCRGGRPHRSMLIFSISERRTVWRKS